MLNYMGNIVKQSIFSIYISPFQTWVSSEEIVND